MKWSSFFWFLVILSICAQTCSCESYSVKSSLISKFKKIISIFKPKGFNFLQRAKCAFYECCEAPYLSRNFTNLEYKLNKYLYGQPLVKNTLLSAIKGHFELSNPRKALVLSFHGSTGVGKYLFLCQLLKISYIFVNILFFIFVKARTLFHIL